MSEPVAVNERPKLMSNWVRPGCTLLGLVLFLAVLVPPLSIEARRYEFVEALQFSIFALVVPALISVGAPWGFLKLTSPIAHLADTRTRHPEVNRSATFVLFALATMIAWRTPAAVDLLERDTWVLAPEAASLLTVGVGLWLECVSSPPLVPRSTRPMRIAICAVSMWTIWILGYLIGFSRAPWYRAFHHTIGQTLSLGADQQLTTGVLCFFAACVFMPVIFWNLITWLHSEDNPDEELRVLVREERRREPRSGHTGTM